MNDCKLSDFTEEQLRTLLRLILKDIDWLNKHVEGLTRYESLANLMQDEITEFTAQLVELDTLATQFAQALVMKQRALKVSSN